MPNLEKRRIDELSCECYNDDPTRVRRVAKKMPQEDSFDRVIVLTKAIADPVRLRILYALAIESLCVCELSRLLDMSLPAISHHLKVLTLSGLLKVRKEGKLACYYFRDERQLKTLLDLFSGFSVD